MKQRKRTNLLIPLLAGSLLAASLCRGAVVFSDDFSEAPGTAILGKAADVGGVWTQGSANGIVVSPANSIDTATKSVTVFNGFTSALGAGQILTVQFDSLAPASGTFLPGNTSWGGISLYTGHTTGSTGSEVMFLGNPSAGFWGTDGGAIGRHFGTDASEVSHVTFTYVYNTGAWTFSTSTGYSTSGTGTASLALNGLRVGNGGAHPNFDNITVDISAVPIVSFFGATPAAGSYSGSRTNVSVQVTDGLSPVNTNSIVLKIDGGTVATAVTKTANITTINFAGSPLSGGALHTAVVTLADGVGTLYTNTWSFTTGFPSLPATLAGPITTGGGNDVTIFTAAGDAWLGTNYNASSSRTLYIRHSMVFNDLNGEVSENQGGCYGGLHLFNGGTERLLSGETWNRTTWSVDDKLAGGEIALNPATTVVVGEWHTIVERIDFSPTGNSTVNVWLDPDFTQTEGNQPNAPFQVSMNNTFDNIRLRCGNGTASAAWTNIIVGATASSVGFPAPANPQFLAVIPANGSLSIATNTVISAQVVPGGNPVSAIAMQVDGGTVTPTSNLVSGVINVSYQPSPALSAGTTHSVQLVVTDNTSAKYTNSWSFATGYPSLPVTVAGPFTTGGGNDLTIFSAAGDPWIGTNYNNSSSRTLYTRYSMTFNDLNNEIGGGGGYGGLHFINGNAQNLLVGNNWESVNWSLEAAGPYKVDLNVANTTWPVIFGEWHTIVVRTDYAPNGSDHATIYFDPNFALTEAAQDPANITYVTNDVSFDNIRLRCGDGTASATLSNIVVAATSAGVGFVAPATPTFQSYVPAQGATGVAVGTPISVTALFGSYPITGGGVSMTLDGNAVSPSFVTTSSSLTINYQPPTALTAGTTHTVDVNVTDANSGTASTSWSFTVDPYPALPVNLAGPVSVTGGGVGTTIWSAQNGWVGGTYLNTNYSGTLYAKFSMEFDSLDGETGGGGAYGGLHFYNGNGERLIVGNNWPSINWSYEASDAGQGDLSSSAIVLGEWHTFVVKVAYVAGGPDNVSIWLDPDLTKTESGQVTPPTGIVQDVAFDSIHLRAGNNTAAATYSNVTVSATSPFATSVPPSVLSIQGGQLSWTSSGVLQHAPAVTGPWTDAGNQANPQSLITTNAAQFYRLRQ